jgi:hypothetical protein
MKETSIRTKDLVIYELDQRTGVWNKMPDSQVDEVTGTVSVPLRHNGTYALGGSPNYDLSSAHAYPVPYRPGRDPNGIRFSGISNQGSIKIFTLDGQLVKSFTFDMRTRLGGVEPCYERRGRPGGIGRVPVCD